MKIAIIHNNMWTCGGGEKLVGLLAKGLNDNGLKTDIITLNISEETKKIIPNGIKIRTLFDSDICDIREDNYFFHRLNLNKTDKNYDFFIFSGNWGMFASKEHRPNLLYCHNISKPKKNKSLDLYGNFITEKIWNYLYKIKNAVIPNAVIPSVISHKIDIIRYIFANKFDIKRTRFFLYGVDEKKIINDAEKIITNSNNIKKQVKDYYKRDSTVIYPPIETKKFKYRKPKDYWVSINRISPSNKRIELQVKAFSKIPNETLYIIGDLNKDPNYYKELIKIKPKNVHFLGVLKEKDLIEKLSYCKGMIFTAKNEDFGMAVVEAMASGKPVVAPNEGGCKETMINGKTGILINDIDEDKIANAIKEISKNPEKYKANCIKQAKKFDVKIFIKRMQDEIINGIKNNN